MTEQEREDGLMLVTAAACGIYETVDDSLKRGVSIHFDDDLPLRSAALMGNVDMVEYLVAKGANVQASNNEALLYAAKRQDDGMVKYLLSKGADIDNMLRHHKTELNQDCLDTLDKYQSQKLREAFEKNFAKLPKPGEKIKLPRHKPPSP
jgi:ankyrin repeat protein